MRSSKHGTPQERVSRALSAGAVCFGRKGFFEATLEDVVDESGLSRGSLYWYFDSKESLYDAVLEFCATRLEAAFAADADDLAGDGPVIARFLRAIARDVEAEEEVYRVMYLAPRPTSADEQLARLTRLFVSYVELVVAAASRRGELDLAGRSQGALVDIVHALAEGLIIRQLCDASFDVGRYVTTAADLLAPGNQRRPARARR